MAASKITLSSTSILTLLLIGAVDIFVFAVDFLVLLVVEFDFLLPPVVGLTSSETVLSMPKLPLSGTLISRVSTSSTALGGSSRVKLPPSDLGSSTGLFLLTAVSTGLFLAGLVTVALLFLFTVVFSVGFAVDSA